MTTYQDLETLLYGKDWTAADVATWDAEEVTAELREAGIDADIVDVRAIIEHAARWLEQYLNG